MGRLRTTAAYSGIIATALLLASGLASFPPAHHTGPPAAAAQVADIPDPPNPAVALATISTDIVQWGTSQPYTGYLAPGVNLRIKTPGTVVDWNIKAWANETTPSATTCREPGVFFGPGDWASQTSGNNAGETGTYISRPSTDPTRHTDDGDQCFARAGVRQVHVTLFIEGKRGGPRFHYHDPLTREGHYDDWDLRIEYDYMV